MSNAPYPGPRDTDTPDNLVTGDTPDPRETPEAPADPTPAPGQDGDNAGGDGSEPGDGSE